MKTQINHPPLLPGFSPAVNGPLKVLAMGDQIEDVAYYYPGEHDGEYWITSTYGLDSEALYSLRLGSEILELNEAMFNTATSARRLRPDIGVPYSHITVREGFAIQILAGMKADRARDAITNTDGVTVAQAMAKEAVVQADALISELNKP